MSNYPVPQYFDANVMFSPDENLPSPVSGNPMDESMQYVVFELWVIELVCWTLVPMRPSPVQPILQISPPTHLRVLLMHPIVLLTLLPVHLILLPVPLILQRVLPILPPVPLILLPAHLTLQRVLPTLLPAHPTLLPVLPTLLPVLPTLLPVHLILLLVLPTLLLVLPILLRAHLILLRAHLILPVVPHTPPAVLLTPLQMSMSKWRTNPDTLLRSIEYSPSSLFFSLDHPTPLQMQMSEWRTSPNTLLRSTTDTLPMPNHDCVFCLLCDRDHWLLMSRLFCSFQILIPSKTKGNQLFTRIESPFTEFFPFDLSFLPLKRRFLLVKRHTTEWTEHHQKKDEIMKSRQSHWMPESASQ